MEIISLNQKLVFEHKEDVIRAYLYLKFLDKGYKIMKNNIEIIVQLYLFGGYKNAEEQENFFKLCLDKKIKASKQSIRNVISEYLEEGHLEKIKDSSNRPRNSTLRVSKDMVPNVKFDKLVLQYVITHAG